MRNQILALLLFGCFSGILQAQTVKGSVKNELNQPLEAAYIYNLNSETHAHTLENGVFVITETKMGDSLRIGLLGYKTKVVQVESCLQFIELP